MENDFDLKQWLIPSCKNGKCGLKNLQGEIVVPHEFRWSAAGYSFAYVEDEQGLNIFDWDGNELRSVKGVTSISRISEGFLQVECKESGADGYVSLATSFKNDIPCKFDLARSFFSGVASVEVTIGHEKQAFGLIDHSGEFLIEPRFLELSFYNSEFDILPFIPLNFKRESSWGLMDKHGKVIVEPSLKWCGWCSEGLLVAAISSDENEELYGLIDPQGQWKLKPSWDGMTTHVTEGSVGARMYGDWGVINTQGSWIVEPRFVSCCGFQNGLALASIIGKNGTQKFGFLNRSGEWAIQPVYDDAFDFQNGLAEIEVFDEPTESYRSGFVDQSGREYWVDD